jgi:hypothetical protein
MAFSHVEHAAEDTAVVYAGFAGQVRKLPEPDRAIFAFLSVA